MSVCAQACQTSHQRAPSLSHSRGDGSSTARMEQRLPSHWGSLLQAVTLPGESWGQDPQHLLQVPSQLCPPTHTRLLPELRGCQPHRNRNPQASVFKLKIVDVLKLFS